MMARVVFGCGEGTELRFLTLPGLPEVVTISEDGGGEAVYSREAADLKRLVCELHSICCKVLGGHATIDDVDEVNDRLDAVEDEMDALGVGEEGPCPW